MSGERYIIQGQTLINLAEAIREKTGSEIDYTPSEMATAIRNLPTGGSILGTKNITLNGSYNASTDGLEGYSSVNVDVPNNYTSGDEGKVVSNGMLVAQTAHVEVTQNGMIDTTLNNSVVVNVSGGGDSPLYTLNESQGGVWVNTNVDVTNLSAFLFKRYNGNKCVGVASLLKSQVAVYKGGDDVYTTVFPSAPAYNVRIYKKLLYVSFDGTGAGTKYVDVYNLEV